MLKELKGGCGHASLVFCGLLKAMKIPCRVVLLLDIKNKKIAPHMVSEYKKEKNWCQVDIINKRTETVRKEILQMYYDGQIWKKQKK